MSTRFCTLHLVRDVAAGDGSEDAVRDDAGLDSPASAFVRRHFGLVSELERIEAALLELQRHLLVRLPLVTEPETPSGLRPAEDRRPDG